VNQADALFFALAGASLATPANVRISSGHDPGALDRRLIRSGHRGQRRHWTARPCGADEGRHPYKVALAFTIGGVLIIISGIVAYALAVPAERRSLESVTRPLSASAPRPQEI
jgi:hypothetical protein